MAQRSVVLTQTSQPEEETTNKKGRWMRHFFSEDISPDNYAIIFLQQRAVWIGVACILLAINEIDHDWYIPYTMPFGSLIPFFLVLGSFFATWMAFRPARKSKTQAQQPAQYPRHWQRIVLIIVLLASIAGAVEFGRGIIMCFLPPQFSNDGTSLDTNAAALLLQGRNPYTDSNVIDIARQFPIQPNWTTPLRVGQFANSLDYPTQSEFQTVLDTDLKAGQAPEFESKVSYPALSFLTLVPFVLLNNTIHNVNVLPFYLLSYLLLVGIAWKIVRPELRPWLVLLALANVPMWASTVGGNLDIFCTLLLVLAWLLRDRRWTSAIFMGLAIATKQTSWFFIPFYAILVFQQYGLFETLRRLSVAGCLALLINLPFILWNPHAFLAGIMAPMADPMFPMGVGIVDLSVTHLIPYFSDSTYKILEVLAMVGSLAWYWRICRKHPEAVMLLAILPLFLAWRSLSSYFYCAAFPLFILMAAQQRKPACEPASDSARFPRPDHMAAPGTRRSTPVGTQAASQALGFWRVPHLSEIWQLHPPPLSLEED